MFLYISNCNALFLFIFNLLEDEAASENERLKSGSRPPSGSRPQSGKRLPNEISKSDAAVSLFLQF